MRNNFSFGYSLSSRVWKLSKHTELKLSKICGIFELVKINKSYRKLLQRAKTNNAGAHKRIDAALVKILGHTNTITIPQLTSIISKSIF
jgi:hypothetical protein